MSPSYDDAPDFSGLIELSRHGDLDLKPVILRVQTDLFLSATSRDRRTVEAFEALAIGLIPIVDADTVEIVARKLAPCPSTPQAVLAALAARGGALRDLVIAQAPTLSAMVIEAALVDGSDIAAAIACREDLSRSLIDEMTSRDIAAVDMALAENRQIALQGMALVRLVDRARTVPDLAQALLRRPDLAPGDLAPLFLHAGEDLRERIGRAVEARSALRPTLLPPREAGPILTGFSARGDIGGFVGALAEMLSLPRGFLATAREPSLRYDLLTLALRTAGLQEEEAVYVFLTLNETVAKSVDRVFELVKLFRTIPRSAARDLLSAVLDVPMAEGLQNAKAHQPYTAANAVRPRAPTAERLHVRPTLPSQAHQSSSVS